MIGIDRVHVAEGPPAPRQGRLAGVVIIPSMVRELSWRDSRLACRAVGDHGVASWILAGLGCWLLVGYWVARAFGKAVRDDEN
jgi:hypothetical protein